MVFGLEDFIGHVGKRIDVFKGIHEEIGFGERNVERKIFLGF